MHYSLFVEFLELALVLLLRLVDEGLDNLEELLVKGSDLVLRFFLIDYSDQLEVLDLANEHNLFVAFLQLTIRHG